MSDSTMDDLIKNLPLREKVPVVALRKLLDEREQIDLQQEKHIGEIKKKYRQQIQPLLQRASQIIQGGKINPEEVKNSDEYMKENEKVENFLKGKVIDNYWNSVFSNSALVDEISEKDEKALQYLVGVENIYDKDDQQSINLKFIFKENSFFKEKQLIRKVKCSGGQVLCVQGDTITWKQGQCLTHNIKKVTNKKTGEKTVMQGQKTKSFFDIFLNWDEKEPEQLSRVSGLMEEIANFVTMDSIDYFLGVINADQISDDDDEEDQEDQGEAN